MPPTKTGRNLPCDECGESIYVPKWKLKENNNNFCSHDCHNKFQSEDVEEVCPECGNVFLTKEYEDITFCSYECTHAKRVEDGSVDYNCDNCGEMFKEHRYRVREQENCFCSKECTSKWRSEQFSGENNPRFVDGTYRDFGNSWLSTRQSVWNRADGNCEWCGLSVEENGRNLSVHHIIPRRKFINHNNLTVDDSNFMKNLLALCRSCHQSAETGSSHYPTNV